MSTTTSADTIFHMKRAVGVTVTLVSFDNEVKLRTLDPTTQNIPPTDVNDIPQSTNKTPLKVKELVLTTHLLCVSDSPSSAHAQVAPCTVLLEFRYT